MQKARNTQESTVTKSFITSKQNAHSKSNFQTDAHHESHTLVQVFLVDKTGRKKTTRRIYCHQASKS